MPGRAKWAVWALIAFLAALQFASTFGPPPPSAQAVAWSGLVLWPLVAWAGWCDRPQKEAA